MKFSNLYPLWVWIWVFISTTVSAQHQITGHVLDSQGNSLTGVSITVKGSQSGVFTDASGNFDLHTSSPNDTLILSFIGFQRETVPVDGRRIMTIILREFISFLDEVVVVGYGTKKRRNLTGAVSSLQEKDFSQGIITTPEQLFQGKMAGVELSRNDGEPGGGFTIRIRGATSIRANNNPLYVIDGFPLDITSSTPGLNEGFSVNAREKNPLSFLNPDDILSIDVLKDAVATAIYGARGANGVVMITTKQGKAGQAEVSYHGYASWGHLRKKLPVLSADGFRLKQMEYGFTTNDFGGNTDWQEEVFRTAFTHNHDLSLSGGNVHTRYRASLNYLDQEGIILNSNLRRVFGRINLNHLSVGDRLKIDMFLTASQLAERRHPERIVVDAAITNPTWPGQRCSRKFLRTYP